MKTRLELANEYALMHMMNPKYKDVDDLEMIQWAYEYADSMLAENEKREQDKRTLAKDENGNCMHFHTTFGRGECFDCGAKLKEEWRPDWSVAPDGYDWFAVDKKGTAYFYTYKPETIESEEYWADFTGISSNGAALESDSSFGYTGNWRNSLRKRPEGK